MTEPIPSYNFRIACQHWQLSDYKTYLQSNRANDHDKLGCSLLEVAAEYRCAEAIAYLAKHPDNAHADMNYAFRRLVNLKNLKRLRYLILNGASLTPRICLKLDDAELTALHTCNTYLQQQNLEADDVLSLLHTEPVRLLILENLKPTVEMLFKFLQTAKNNSSTRVSRL